ncbi:Spore germination protein YndE [compost metagenome]
MHDVETMIRVNEVLLPIIVIPVLIISLTSYQSAKWENLFPLFHVQWGSFFKGVIASSGSYLGIEIMMIFLAKAKPSKYLMKANIIGLAIPGFVYTLIVISGILVFGVDELPLLSWPTLELVKTTHVPGLILERVESAFLSVWVAAVFTSVGNLYYALSMLIAELFRLKSHRLVAILLFPLFYWIALIPPNIQQLFVYQKYLGYLGWGVALIIPLLLLFISIFRKLKGASGV